MGQQTQSNPDFPLSAILRMLLNLKIKRSYIAGNRGYV